MQARRLLRPPPASQQETTPGEGAGLPHQLQEEMSGEKPSWLSGGPGPITELFPVIGQAWPHKPAPEGPSDHTEKVFSTENLAP